MFNFLNLNKEELSVLKNIYDNLNIYIIVFKKNGDFLFCNKKIKKEFNKNKSTELININILHNFLSFCNIEQEFLNNLSFLKAVINKEINFVEFQGIFHNIYYEPSVSLIDDKYILSFTRYSKNEEIKFLKKITKKHPLIDLLIENYPLPIFYKNKYGYFINCNKKFVEFFNKEKKSDIIGKTIYDFEKNHELASIYEQKDNKLLLLGEKDLDIIDSYEFAYSFSKNIGIANIYKSLYLDENNEIEGIVGVIVNKENNQPIEKKLNNFELSIALQTDYLTKIPNKLSFEMKIIEKINYYKRYKDKGSFVLLCLDIDHFKMINEKYGKKIGNEVIKIITKKIEILIRQTDYFFKIGGEEFALILDGVTFEGSIKLAKKILKQIQITKIDLINNTNITLSIGLCEFNNNTTMNSSDAYKILFEITNNALYKAKNNGRNQIKIVEDYYD